MKRLSWLYPPQRFQKRFIIVQTLDSTFPMITLKRLYHLEERIERQKATLFFTKSGSKTANYHPPEGSQ